VCLCVCVQCLPQQSLRFSTILTMMSIIPVGEKTQSNISFLHHSKNYLQFLFLCTICNHRKRLYSNPEHEHAIFTMNDFSVSLSISGIFFLICLQWKKWGFFPFFEEKARKFLISITFPKYNLCPYFSSEEFIIIQLYWGIIDKLYCIHLRYTGEYFDIYIAKTAVNLSTATFSI
jgi:hypothetical protein